MVNFKKIKVIFSDVDGTLTNGKIYVGSSDSAITFDIQDGIGHRLAYLAGLQVVWLSGRKSSSVEKRAKDLNVSVVYQGKTNKLEVAEMHCQKKHLSMSEIAFIGDDLIDIPLLEKVGWAVAVRNAVPEVKNIAHYITAKNGGDGAFREMVEKLLIKKNCWKQVIKKFLRLSNGGASLQ
jgi:3-deoxy-D-manno-octulosonate 8-phosphate phosphatase (KDO 8-P phosphatase)